MTETTPEQTNTEKPLSAVCRILNRCALLALAVTICFIILRAINEETFWAYRLPAYFCIFLFFAAFLFLAASAVLWIASIIHLVINLRTRRGFGYVLATAFYCMFSLSMIMPTMGRGNSGSIKQFCAHDMQRLGTALTKYAADSNGLLPESTNWVVELERYGWNDSNFHLWYLYIPEGNTSYALNSNVCGKPLASFSPDTVLAFETSTPGKSPVGTVTDLSAKYHVNRGANILFINTQVKFIYKGDFKKLKW
jgi:hypothetical protein